MGYRDGSGVHRVLQRLEEKAQHDRSLSRHLKKLAKRVSRVDTIPPIPNLSPLVERVIRTARAFDGLTECDLGGPRLSTAEAVKELETSARDGGEQDEVLNALRYVVSPTTESFERETAAV